MLMKRKFLNRIIIGLVFIAGCATITDDEKFIKGKEIYYNYCSSCHFMKNVKDRFAPSLSDLGNLDSTVLLDKLKKIKNDKIHQWLKNEIDADDNQYLIYYFKHVYDVKAFR